MRDKILHFLKHPFILNTNWLVAERVFQMAISLVVGLWVARYLGPSDYGIINYVAAFISFALPICSLGLEGVLVKRFVDTPQDTGKIIGTAVLFEFVTAVILSIAICVVVNLTNAGDKVKTAVAFWSSINLLFKSFEVIEFWYQSKLRSKISSIVKMIGYLCMSAYRVILLLLGKSVVWFAFATSLDAIIIAVLLLVLYRKHSAQRMQIDWDCGLGMLKESYHFILSGLMVVIYSQMDKIMIQYMLDDAQVGLYSAAYAICNLWLFIPGALIKSAQPIIMKHKNQNEELYLLRLKQLYAGIFVLGIGVSLFVSVLAKPIIALLYGAAYAGAAVPLAIGIWYGTFAQLGSARGIWILCEKKNRFTKYYVAWGAVVNLILNWFFIRAWGIEGAAIATLITQIFVSFFAPLFFKETREHTRILWNAVTFTWLKKEKKI